MQIQSISPYQEMQFYNYEIQFCNGKTLKSLIANKLLQREFSLIIHSGN